MWKHILWMLNFCTFVFSWMYSSPVYCFIAQIIEILIFSLSSSPATTRQRHLWCLLSPGFSTSSSFWHFTRRHTTTTPTTSPRLTRNWLKLTTMLWTPNWNELLVEIPTSIYTFLLGCRVWRASKIFELHRGSVFCLLKQKGFQWLQWVD